MLKSIRVKPKKRGRPATGKDPFYGVRMPDDLVAAVDKWAAENCASSRSDAIRRLIEVGLKRRGAAPAPRQPIKGSRRKASEMASRELDDLVDKSVPAVERERRKRRLVLGPKEFRDVRGDQSKKKR